MKQLILVIAFYSTQVLCCKDILPEQPLKQAGIYILHSSGVKVLSQCARSSYTSNAVWTPTVKQVQIIDKKLKKYIKENNLKLKMTPESKFHRQYFGFLQSGRKFVYVNVYPTPVKLKRPEGIFPIVSCAPDGKYWGANFSIDSMQFESVDSNEPNKILEKTTRKTRVSIKR
ncbi:MAG: hypothetical protein OQK51_06110 [Kangiellaceae bacterium]|nr:hypothetical protein [Kangiellaceae bacterium]